MNFPKFVKFEETQEVEFNDVGGGELFDYRGTGMVRGYFQDKADVAEYGVGHGGRLCRIGLNDLVTIHRPLEIKPLGECRPGDVVEVDGCTQSRVVMQGSGLFNLVTLRAEAWVPGNDRVVTIIGKAVCDEG